MRSILAITTSPRRHGNSESALDTVLESFDTNIFFVEKVVLEELNIAPCKGCGACEKTGECVQKDDYQNLAEKIRNADAVILASPVYSLSLCSQAKALIDRCQVFWSQKFVLKTFTAPHGERIGLFIATAGQNRDDIFDHAVPVAGFLFEIAGIKKKNTQYLLLKGVDKKNDFINNSDAVQKAKDAGEHLKKSVEELK